MNEQEAREVLEKVFGEEELIYLTTELTSRYGDKLNDKLISAISHLDREYDLDAIGELFTDGQFSDVSKIGEWAEKGSEASLTFESMRGESGVEPEKDVDYEGLDFGESMREYD